jgi:phage/plasmid-like protein (TIGR03299 family)
MPDDVERMFSVGRIPWHKPLTGDRTTVRDGYPQTFAEARVEAGLDWDPIALPAVERLATDEELRERFRDIIMASSALPVGESVDSMMRLYEKTFARDQEFRRIARSDNRRFTLSYQRDSYNIIPNSVYGEIIDALLQAEPGTVKLETGGSLGGGRRVWMLARLNEPVKIQAGNITDGSLTFPYLGLTNDHTGHAKLTARLTTVRIVCGNTFSAAEAEGQRTGAVYSFSHRSDWRKKIGEARAALHFAREEASQYAAAMSDLLGIKVTPEQEQLWLRMFVPDPPDGIISDQMAANRAKARAAVQGFLDGPAVEGAGVRGTAYGLVQAAGEYLDWGRRAASWDSRVNRSLLRTEPLKAQAAKLAREVALAA